MPEPASRLRLRVKTLKLLKQQEGKFWRKTRIASTEDQDSRERKPKSGVLLKNYRTAVSGSKTLEG
jgi:hypothetical protein